MNFPNRDDKERDLDRELKDHLDLEAESQIANGVSAAEARNAAARALGRAAQIKEDVREVWGWTTLEAIWQDIRFACRLMAKSPAFATVAILTLALGIGANTAIFTVVNALLIQPLPYADADRIVVPATIFTRQNSDRGSVSYPDYQDWKSQTGLFESVAVYTGANFTITDGAEPERIRGLNVDRAYFDVMKTRPILGRTFSAAEDAPGAANVVVLSHGLWMRRFGGDPTVLGRSIELSGTTCRVVGIMPQNSTWPEEAEMFRPLGFGAHPPSWTQRRDNHVFLAIARLKPNVSIETAQAKLTTLGARIAKEAANRAGTNWKLHPLKSYIVGPSLSLTLWILLGAVLIVLLIACVNVANLLLARGAGREREVAVRTALGAGWKRLGTQFLVESIVLASIGGALGIILGWFGTKALVRFAPEEVPRLDFVHIDPIVLAFAFALCLLTAIIFGAAPLFHALQNQPADAMRGGGRSASEGANSSRLRNLLVVSELALAVLLVAGAGLLVRSFITLRNVNPGFPSNNILTMQISLPRSRYAERPQIANAWSELTASISSLPGVKSATAVGSLPLGGGGFYLGRVFLTTGQPDPPASKDTAALWAVAQPNYFETMRIPIITGRAFTAADTAKSNPVIIISHRMAKEMFGQESPLGRRIRSWRDENVYREIVGIAGDVRYSALNEDVNNVVFVPHAQDSWNALMLVVRANSDVASLLPTVRSAIRRFDPKLAISEVRTMEQVVNLGLARTRFSMYLLTVFAGIALLMAAIGIYGVIAYNVEQRTKEIGIRVALGAAQSDIFRDVTGRAVVMAGIGVVAGLASALMLTRWMESLLYGIEPNDKSTFAISAGILMCVAIAAAIIPARKAAAVDPLIALRYE